MWLTREENGCLYCYTKKPYKQTDLRLWVGDIWDCWWELNPELFPEVHWEDDEPTWIRMVYPDWVINSYSEVEDNVDC